MSLCNQSAGLYGKQFIYGLSFFKKFVFNADLFLHTLVKS